MSAQDLEQRALALLPELPPMAMTIAGDGPDAGHWYRAEQMRDYAIRAIVAALRQQPAPVGDDARMARALEAARCGLAPEHVSAIEEAIAAYNPSCGARTVRVVDDGNGVRACSVLTAARAQGVQS